ncbi:hypothetical protein DPMN_047855 [Dreissena polymorpha]|uniref:Uncharacterized protein n=1 Tax=Dreissena polymorpha TaxID=45954 RepID=A0A9D4D8H1_DREPO|nr:hypothetical protein DPMN_047855 [Dreissena polymorpha]
MEKGNTLTTRSIDSQEPGQTTSVHTEESDETKRVLPIPGEQNKQPKSNGVKTKKELFTDTLILVSVVPVLKSGNRIAPTGNHRTKTDKLLTAVTSLRHAPGHKSEWCRFQLMSVD